MVTERTNRAPRQEETFAHGETFENTVFYRRDLCAVRPLSCSSPSAVRRPLFTATAENSQPFEQLARGTGFDRIFRHPRGIDRGWSLAKHLEHERGLQDDRVAVCAALTTFEHGTQVLGIVGGIAAF